ncbi:hypothetical protein V8C86DRAFT_2688447 [Haematococcus lacustris]
MRWLWQGLWSVGCQGALAGCTLTPALLAQEVLAAVHWEGVTLPYRMHAQAHGTRASLTASKLSVSMGGGGWSLAYHPATGASMAIMLYLFTQWCFICSLIVGAASASFHAAMRGSCLGHLL